METGTSTSFNSAYHVFFCCLPTSTFRIAKSFYPQCVKEAPTISEVALHLFVMQLALAEYSGSEMFEVDCVTAALSPAVLPARDPLKTI